MKVSIKKTNTGINKDQLEVISSFVKFLQSQVPLSSDIQIELTNDRETTGTTGLRMPGSKIYVLVKKRMLIFSLSKRQPASQLLCLCGDFLI